jgi:hypothetical protein
MHDYAVASPFPSYRNWTTGYCLHSDWATGYLLHLLVPETQGFAYLRLKAYSTSPQMKSDFNARDKYDKWPLNICRYERYNCTATSEACHYMSPRRMQAIFQKHYNQAPYQYHNGTTSATYGRPNVVELRQTTQGRKRKRR